MYSDGIHLAWAASIVQIRQVVFFSGGAFGLKFRLLNFREIDLGSLCGLLGGAEYMQLNASFYFIRMNYCNGIIINLVNPVDYRCGDNARLHLHQTVEIVGIFALRCSRIREFLCGDFQHMGGAG